MQRKIIASNMLIEGVEDGHLKRICPNLSKITPLSESQKNFMQFGFELVVDTWHRQAINYFIKNPKGDHFLHRNISFGNYGNLFLIQGPSGTGKSFILQAIFDDISGGEIFERHPSYSQYSSWFYHHLRNDNEISFVKKVRQGMESGYGDDHRYRPMFIRGAEGLPEYFSMLGTSIKMKNKERFFPKILFIEDVGLSAN